MKHIKYLLNELIKKDNELKKVKEQFDKLDYEHKKKDADYKLELEKLKDVIIASNQDRVREIFKKHEETPFGAIIAAVECFKIAVDTANKLKKEPALIISSDIQDKFIKFLKDEGVYEEFKEKTDAVDDEFHLDFEQLLIITDPLRYTHEAFYWGNESKWADLNAKWEEILENK